MSTPTEISEHAKEAAKSFRTLELKDFPYDIGSTFDISVHRAIQHGINLATAAKDARIAELEAELLRADGLWKNKIVHIEQNFTEMQQQLQSKDREIERLKEEVSHLSGIRARFVLNHIDRICGECGHDKDEDGQCANCITSQLAEANAKLAEAEEEISHIKEILEDPNAVEINLMRGTIKLTPNKALRFAGLGMSLEEARALASQLSSAQAEIERLKVQLDIAFHPSHLTPTNETP